MIIIRVVYGYENDVPVVITLYIARKERDFRGGVMKIKYYPDSDILEKCLSSIQNLDYVRGSNSPRRER